MTIIDNLLLSRFYQISKISIIQYENILLKIKNIDLQTIISKQIYNYDVIAKECSTIAKTNKIDLPDNMFFKRCSELIEKNFENLHFKSLESIISCTTITHLHTMIELYDVEIADSETIKIGKHLLKMQEDFLQLLQELK